MAILLRPHDWTVPRRGMCTAFWCGVLLIFTSIVLLVTSRHKGGLYRSWGSVFLGCGFCLLLICLILCIHAYFVMQQQHYQQTTATNSYHNIPITYYITNDQDEVKSLLTTSTSPGIKIDFTSKERMETSKIFKGNYVQHNDPLYSNSDGISSYELNQSVADSSSQDEFRGNDNPLVLSEVLREFSNAQSTGTVQQCRVKPLVTTAADYNTNNLPMSDNESNVVVKALRVTHIPNDPATVQWNNESQKTSLPRQCYRAAGVFGNGVTRSFGPAGMITVTPLTTRRTKEFASDMNSESADDDELSIDKEVNLTASDIIESKATVYDNVLNMSF